MQNTIKILILTTLMASSLYSVDCDQTYKVQSFAQRFYVEVLERQPDNLGLDGWTNDLTSRRKTGTDVANGFIFSEEFVGKDKTNEEFVTIMYRAFFNRPAAEDPEGTAYWLEKLNNGEGKEAVSHGFLYSQEFANLSAAYGIQAYEGASFTTTALDNFVKRFYSVILGRDADSAGLKNWTDKLSTNEATGSDIAFGFILSAEYDMASKTDTEYLNTLYSAFFNRAADTEGFNGWMTELTNGTSREEVLDGFLHSQEFITLSNSFGILAFEGAPVALLPNNRRNLPPEAHAGVSQSIILGDTLTLDATNSIDIDGRLECYWWVEINTLLSTKIEFSKDNFSIGTHNIRLTVIDNDGASKSDTVTITTTEVLNTPPTVTAGADKSVTVDTAVSVIGTASDSDGSIIDIEWTEGVAVLSTSASFSYIPTSVGAHTLTLTVMDNDGASSSDTVIVTANANSAPTWTASSYDTGLTIEDGTDAVQNIKDLIAVSSDADEDTITYSIVSISVPNSAADQVAWDNSVAITPAGVLVVQNLMTNDPNYDAAAGSNPEVSVKVKATATGGSSITYVKFTFVNVQ